MSRTCLYTLALMGCLLLAAPVKAQNIYASITGTVTDQNSAIVPGATITATNTDTGFKRTAVTGERGDYLLIQLPIGNYTLTTEMQGFRPEARTGIVLQVDQRAREDFKLQVGAATETVQVTASVPLVQSETSSVGQVINNTQVIELPLNGRNFNQLPLIVIGAQPAPAGLQEHWHRPARELAHGLKQSLDLATAIAAKPEVLLLDEPTAGLTTNERAKIGEVIQHLVRDAGVTVILIEHDLDFVLRIADRIAVLHDGRVIECGPPEVVAHSQVVREAYVGVSQ